MSTTVCEQLAEQAVVERYLAGQLSADEAAGFEEHYLTCADCQEALRMGALVRTALPGAVRAARSRRRWLLLGPPGLAAALAVVLLRGSSAGPLNGLGGVAQAPIYLGVPVRNEEPTQPDSLFARAMDAYLAEQYEDAAAGLRAALEAGVAPAPAEFFLGASLLITGSSRAAAEAFARVIALGDTPYQAEAQYYRAKALLRLGRGADALALLHQPGVEASPIAPAARALADSIRRVLPR
jgi:tetratricopeptide (TPR) repeat protein